MFSKAFAVLGLASAASAHIVMTNPVPFGNPNNSPLEGNGSDFPCKNLSPDGSTANSYKAGSTQQLSFKGSAVHGGGSCQVSVTTDKNPTKQSQWKVIKSIEGGCPAQDQTGNMGDNADAEIPYKYDFTIPEEMPEGDYVFAWTWFNKVGNREMYMNCASVEVTGGSGDEGFMNTLPDMFVANIENECFTLDSADVVFPDPGQAVERLNGATEAWGAPTGNGCAAAVTGAPSNPTQPAPQPTVAPSSSQAPAPTATSVPGVPDSPAPTPTLPGGVFVTIPTAAPTAAPEPEEPKPEEPEPEEPKPEEPKPEEPAPGDGGDGGSGFAAGTACSSEGAWNCIGGSSFQRCASGTWSEVIAMAAGVGCESGQSSDLKVNALNAKRSMRRSKRTTRRS
ncbi:hypothetical protein ACO1O0_008952 [Amphichorda felina]